MELLERIQQAGIRVEPLPDGRLWVEPRSRLTDELRGLIASHKAELLALLSDLQIVAQWLDQIEERDPAIRDHVLRQCQTDAGARAYFLRHARGEFLH